MWAISMADSLLRTHDFCPSSSHCWRQNQSYQEMANTYKCHRGLKFYGIHRILPLVYPQIHAGNPTLHKLTLGENAGKKSAIQWNSKCQLAFDDLKRLCTTMPILAYADFTTPFKLHTDACGSGLGAVLYQTHEDGTDSVIAYARRSLSKAESHYPAHKLNFVPSSGW